MEISFDENGDLNQEFNKGVSSSKITSEKIKCNKLRVVYSLDKSIWGDDFRWSINYLSYELREFFYLFPNVKFEIKEIQDKVSNIFSYHFKNGLRDRLEIEMLNANGGCFFNHQINYKTVQFEFDAAFAFRQYTVDSSFIKTYVNNEVTPENGTHLDGLLKGITYGVMKYFQANNLVNDYKISEQGIRQGIVCLINLKLESPAWSGCVRNKLANSEIIEPIANHISETLYQSILNDSESTSKLIDKFKIRVV